MARPTIKEVAARAQVSLKTVSRVVNDEPGVHADTRERVRQIQIDALRRLRNILENEGFSQDFL